MTADRTRSAAQRLSEIALRRALGLRRGSSVVIEAWTSGLPLAEGLWLAARRLGIRPTLLVQPEEAFFAAQRLADPARANSIGRAEIGALDACDAYLYVMGPRDARRLETLPDAARHAYDRRFREWAYRLETRRIPKLLFFSPETFVGAADAPRRVVAGWEHEWVRGSEVAPARLRALARPWVRALRQGRRVTITHPNGTDIELGLAGTPAVVQDGAVDARDLADGWMWTSLPSGVVSVAVDGRRGDGRFLANRPSRTRRGTIEGIRWPFAGGRLLRPSAERGGALFAARYRAAGPERERPAVLSIGLNPAIRDLPLMEDQEQGVVTLYIGHNDDFGGRTRGSFRMHAMLRGADVTVDGRRLLHRGRWTAISR